MNIGFEAKRLFHNSTGLGNYSRDLVRIMSEHFPQNQYFLYNPKKAEKNLFHFKADNIVEKLPSSALYKTFYNVWRQSTITVDLQKDKIDIYHGLSGELPIGIKSTSVKSIVTIHDLIFLRYPQFYKAIDRYIYYKKSKHAAEVADVVIAISQQTKQDIIDFLKIPESKIKVVYQGCNAVFKTLLSEAEKKSLLSRFNLPDNFILNVGKIEERKNVLTLVKAIKNINTQLVVLGGETPYAAQIKQYIVENKMQHKVIFLNGLNIYELAALYQSSSIFAYPSFFEGFGIPIIEALFSKVPVITSQGSCFAEAGGKYSVYVNPKSAEDLETEIVRLLNDREMRNNIAEKSFEYVQQFNDNNIAENLINIYKSLA